MTLVVEEVKKEVNRLEKDFAGDDSIKKFEKTEDLFDELIEAGLAKRRGNNLLSPSDAHIKSFSCFNKR